MGWEEGQVEEQRRRPTEAVGRIHLTCGNLALIDCANGAHPDALSPSPCAKMMLAVCREVASITIWLILRDFCVD